MWAKSKGHIDPFYNDSRCQDVALPRKAVMRKSNSTYELPDINESVIYNDTKADKGYIKRLFSEATKVSQSTRSKWDPTMSRLTQPIIRLEPTNFHNDVKSYLEVKRIRRNSIAKC